MKQQIIGEIERTRNQLNYALVMHKEQRDDGKLLQLSHYLDELILEYMKLI